MESTSERRFDANFVMQILLEIAHEQSLEKLLQKLVERVMERSHMVCAQVWLIEKGDLCATCPRRPECPDQSRCLHLVAARGKSTSASGKRQCPFEDPDSRVPLCFGPIGEAVATREPRSVTRAVKQPASLPGLEWLREEDTRQNRIVPIWLKGEPFAGCLSMRRHRAGEGVWL